MKTEDIRIITLSKDNIEQEHICCAIADKKSAEGVRLKKEWLLQRFDEGLRFKKADIRGKVFIEYLPADAAWAPIEAAGYMYINCFWVSGQYAGTGLGIRLLDECFKDAADMNGIVVLSSKAKRPFLADKKYLVKKGFEVCDAITPGYELLVRPFKDAPLPRFRDNARLLEIEDKAGLTIYYTNQCPFTAFYINELREKAEELELPFKAIRIESREEAGKLPAPYPTYNVFYKGKLLTHEILTRDRLQKHLDAADK